MRCEWHRCVDRSDQRSGDTEHDTQDDRLAREGPGQTTTTAFPAPTGLKTFNSYDRMAIVTDTSSVRRTIKAFGWLIPGEIRVFLLDALSEAETWITG